MKTIINKNYYFNLALVLFVLIFLSCNRVRPDIKRELAIKERIHEDSLKECKNTKARALEQIKRGNLVLYRNIEDYLHAQEYFFDKYNIVLIPETELNICAQEIMDSVIFSKFGKDLLLTAEKEISETYKSKPSNQYLNGVFSYAEKLPEYPGGIDSLYCDIYSSVNNVSVCDINLDFGKEIIVSFIVDTEGNIKEPKITMRLCPEIDEKTINVLMHLKKKWSPAIFENKKVPYLMTLSIDWNENDIKLCNQ